MGTTRVITLILTVMLTASHIAIADDKIFGKPVSEINPAWCSASIFSGIPTKGTYSISGRFYLESVYMNIAVGSYTTCAQKQGTFLLALEMPDPDAPRPVTLGIKILQEFDKRLKPSLMKFQGGNFLLFDCEQCKSATLYEISSAKFIAKDHLDEKQITDGTEGIYFVDCKGVWTTPEFVFADEKKESDDKYEPLYPAQSCFKVNQDEYLMLDHASGLFSWNTRTNEANYLISTRYVSIEREITGKGNERFVLISYPASRYNEVTGYLILYRTPNSEDGAPYKLEDLIFPSDHLERGVTISCEGWDKSFEIPPVLSSLNGYKVLNSGTADLKIIFDITELNCRTLKSNHITKTFLIGDKSFRTSITRTESRT